MSLKLKLQNNNSIYLNNIIGLKGTENCLYIKIMNQSGDAECCCISISCFACNESDIPKSGYREQIGVCIENKSHLFTPNLEGENFIKQGYEYLKTLPEFAGCVDC